MWKSSRGRNTFASHFMSALTFNTLLFQVIHPLILMRKHSHTVGLRNKRMRDKDSEQLDFFNTRKAKEKGALTLVCLAFQELPEEGTVDPRFSNLSFNIAPKNLEDWDYQALNISERVLPGQIKLLYVIIFTVVGFVLLCFKATIIMQRTTLGCIRISSLKTFPEHYW